MAQRITVDIGNGEQDTWARLAPHDWVIIEGFGDYSLVPKLEALYAEYVNR